jgi:hypothetical protein
VIEEQIRQKIQDLVSRSDRLVAAASGSALARDNRHMSECEGWITEALNVIELAVPMPSNAYRRRAETIIIGKDGSSNV